MTSATPPLVRVPCPLCGGSRTRHERIIAGFALERCRGCGFVFTNPRYPDASILGQYDRRDEASQLEIWERITTPTILAEYERVLDELEGVAPGGGRLLDFGCGPCYFLERAVRRGWDAHGVEIGPWAREAARRRGLSNVRIGLLADQGFSDGFFDVAYSNQVIEHLADPKPELGELSRVLRPGGLLYVAVPNYRRIPVIFNRDDFALDTPMGHLNYFTPRTLSKLLRACGFMVLRTATSGGLKLENLFGHPTQSDILDAIQSRADRPEPPRPAEDRTSAGCRGLVRKILRPPAEFLAYRLAQLGMGLEAFARKPD